MTKKNKKDAAPLNPAPALSESFREGGKGDPLFSKGGPPPLSPLKRLLGCLRGRRALLAGSLLLALVNVGATLMVPILIGRAIDAAAEGRASAGLLIEALVFVGLAAVSGWLATLAGNRMTYTVVRNLRRDAFHTLQKLPLATLDAHPQGDTVSRITADVDAIADGLLLGFSQLFTGIITIVGTFAFMAAVSWQIALAVLVLTPISLFCAKFIGGRTHRYFGRRAKAQGEQTAYIDEALTGAKVLKAFGRGEAARARFEAGNEALEKASLSAIFFSSLTNPITRFVNSFIYAAVALGGALLAVHTATAGGATFTVGELSALLAYTNQYTKPFNEISGVITEFQNALACAGRLFALLDAPIEREADGDAPADAFPAPSEGFQERDGHAPVTPAPAPSEGFQERDGHAPLNPAAPTLFKSFREGGKGEPLFPKGVPPLVPPPVSPLVPSLEFRQVAFRYLPERPLIEDFSLSVSPGQRIAIVGPTGCGKTTLINLIMRFYDVTGGAILWDERDIRTLPRRQLRRQIGMVLQETWLMQASVHDNIAFGKPGASREEVIAAAKAAHADSFIRRLPEGYDTVLDGEGGSSLSQGQRQLLCIARVMLALPPMLILDEATSSIDTRTEQKIQAAFASLMQGRTSFIVAHRLSTVKGADCILVMRDGRIVERGRHDELLAQNGFYATLWNSR